MNPAELFQLAIRALGANKLRSVLTMLGIIIGVGAVITLMSVGEGVQVLVTNQIQSAGSNLLFVIPGQIGQGQSRGAAAANSLTVKDAEAIQNRKDVPDVVRVAAELTLPTTVERGTVSQFNVVSGTVPEYTFVRNYKTTMGRFIEERELNSRARVAVLGSFAYERFFPNGGYPIGETIRINNIQFQIIGVMEEKGGSGFGSEDGNIWIPLSTAHSRLSNQRSKSGDYLVSAIYVEVSSEDRMDATKADIERTVRARHNIDFRDDDDFTVINQADLVAIFGQITGVLTLFLGAIAGISLLVGGIGIMNIMLVSVTERTREIGVRKAIGAKRRDILTQFLIEAIVLSLIGGVVGILLGVSGAAIISQLVDELTAIVSPFAVILATGFSVGVGLLFGMYPAYRASQLNPIEALRYE